MSAVSSSESTQSPEARRRIYRGGAVLGALAVNAVLWFLGRAVGADYQVADATGAGEMVGLGPVVVSTAVMVLLGWGVLALLERFTQSARGIWTVLAIAAALLSIVPIFLVEASGATQLALTVLHLAPAAVVVPMFRRQF